MKIYDYIIGTILAITILILFIGIPYGIHLQSEFQKSCESRGGTFINDRSYGYMCVKLEKI